MDPITCEVFSHRFAAVCEEMGAALCRSAFSANIKERRDFSCALFDGAGELVAQAAHIPVHLGSTQLAVRAALAAHALRRGDVVAVNDPFAGGTHLPDLTLVAPVFASVSRKPLGYLAVRAHHADIGGMAPGSMPLAEEIFQEGFRVPPILCVRNGRWVREFLDLFLANTRVSDERQGDLFAQLSAIRIGQQRIVELARRHGPVTLREAMRALQDYSERLARALIRRIPAGSYRARDFLDDDGLGTRRIPIEALVCVQGDSLVVDFSGSAAQVRGCVNANHAIAWAAVLYVLQILADGKIPPNSGLMRPVQVVAPEGSVVNAGFPAAMAGGNVETSQRLVDVLLRALSPALPEEIPAASCGSMNNVAFGGYDERRRRYFTYYETIGGGAGGGPSGPGESAIHTHMTNTLNTPIEALESSYPIRVTSYRIRTASGGLGRHRGGDGIVRELQALTQMRATLLTERRAFAPYGLAGGFPGKRGRNETLDRKGKATVLPAKVVFTLETGDRLRISTPGGGGWGPKGSGKWEKGARGR